MRKIKSGKSGQKETEQSALSKLTGVLQLPAAVLAGVAHMEISGNREVVLEGTSGIIAYTDEAVRVKTGKYITKLSGKNLELKCIQVDSLVVQGFITAIEFQF